MRKSSILQFLLPLFLVCSLLSAQGVPGESLASNARLETLSAAGGLRATLQQARSGSREAIWVAYSVPMTTGQGRLCCYDKGGATTCHLKDHSRGWGSRDLDQPLRDPRLKVLLRFEAGELAEIRSFSEDCPLDVGGSRLASLGNVKPEESVAYLSELAKAGSAGYGNPAAEAVLALAMHRNADSALEELASAPSPRKTREDALFWIGRTRGESGARFLAGLLRDEADDEIRKKAIFSLSTSGSPSAAEAIARISREDRSREIRGEALFWLAQMDTPEVPEMILKAVEDDPDLSVRKKAVFALFHLKNGKSVPYLIRVGRETQDREIRKEALFWLSQSEEPAAVEYLDESLSKRD
ncbi:MAG TPA: HEAT repeat domain-containing protein [Thermoanaerobaculia bacterium]|nr:HEAT repeat domain-containing protein [Thermoanaerobaculia bacterium]